MKLGLDLSENKVSAPSTYTTVPAGEYVVNVAKMEVKDNKSRTGAYLETGYEVLEGTLAGAMIKDIINISNPNKEAERIGRDRLKTIATYIGHKNPNKIADTDEIVGKGSFKITVEVQEDGVYKNNRVKYLTKIESEAPVKEEAPKASAKKPWQV